MRIAIYGGSFNPVHNEHKNIVINAIKQFKIDKTFVVPSKIAPHKQDARPLAFEHRFNMLKIAFSGENGVEISDFENKQNGVSYTYLTLQYFKNLYPDAELFFLVGTDMLKDFPTWKNPELILELATLLVTKRDGDNFLEAEKFYYSHFDKKFVLSTYKGTSLSSTKINNYLKLGVSCQELLPHGVYEYIINNGLIKSDYLYEYVKNSLTEKRLRHTANVMTLSQKYAKRLDEDEKRATISALLHDVAKYKDASCYPDFYLDHFVPQPVVHQYLGAYIAKTELGIKDEDVLNAIRYHTSARRNMSKLEKIVFLADLLEEDRVFDGVDEIRKAVEADFDSGFKFAVGELNKFLNKKNQDVYFLTKECLDSLNNN